MENIWSSDGFEEFANANGADNEFTYADGEEDGLSASGKIGFWARNKSRSQNAESTAIHTAEKMQSTGIAQSQSMKAAAYSKKLVKGGVNPQIAHEAGIGKAIMIATAKKKQRASDSPKETVLQAMAILQRLI